MLVWVPVLIPSRFVSAAAGRTGERVYHEQCAKCHGGIGEGVDEYYPNPLAGDRSRIELTEYIEKTMPEDAPGTCIGQDALNVANFIYDAFYSPTAQARNKPARIELSRLTVRQYQNVLADLVGSFRTDANWDDKRGLRGEYFKSRRFRDSERVLERLDPEVKFEFGETSPDPEKLDPYAFSAKWEGSVLAPETGDYEFIVRTEHATRLWVNDTNQPLIDAWVKSGSDSVYRESIHLLGGRVYPIRLEFSKAKQGVDDSKKDKPKPPVAKAAIYLEWKLPHQVGQVIPARNLSPSLFPETFVVRTPFPPDDRSVGYERGSSISKAWDQATTDGAIEAADYIKSHLNELSAAPPSGADRELRLREFCQKFAERAFRRPLTDEQRRLYIDRQWEGASDPVKAVHQVVLLVLKSPRFLYREVGGSGDAYDVAARISFGLWDSLPDQQLWSAAANGQLATRQHVVQQAERMLTNLRASSKLNQFFRQWLKIDQVPDISKDRERYPLFNDSIVTDLRTGLELFIEDVIWSEDSDFRQLLLMDSLYLNGRLAQFYDLDLPIDEPFQKMALDVEHRAGVLSHPYLMAGFAYTGTSSPIHRGVFIARSVLGRTLRPPPEAVAPLAPELQASLTTRERVVLQTKPESCQSCHAMINPLGFTLEHFDAVGRYRSEEKGRPIDATGTYLTRTGERLKFAGVRELAAYLANSEETHSAFVTQLFHYLVKQPIRAYGPEELPTLRKAFAENQFNMRKLVVEIVASSAAQASKVHP